MPSSKEADSKKMVNSQALADYFLHSVRLILLLFVFVSCISKPHASYKDLVWHKEDGYSWAELLSGHGKTGFKALNSKETGITLKNRLTKESLTQNELLSIGSGVAAGDIDQDGLVDLYFAQLNGPNKLFKNEGNFKFRDITESGGVSLGEYYSTGVLFADVDGDSDLDLLVTTNSNGSLLFINDGEGHFKRKKNSGLDSTAVGGTTLAMADIDEDRDLDLYITHYRDISVRDVYAPSKRSTRAVVKKEKNTFKVKSSFKKYYTIINARRGPVLREIGIKDELYLNKGMENGEWRGFKKIKNLKNRFFDAKGKKMGVKPDWGLTARFEDLNNDALPDLYVCNDYWTPDRIWINQGKGIFKAIEPLQLRHTSFASMSVTVGDVNNDDYPDLFVTDMLHPKHQRRLREFVAFSPFPEKVGVIDNQPQYTQNSLYINREDNTFAETANYSGVAASGWSWGSAFLDVDLDGLEDLVVNNGYSYDTQDLDTQLYLEKVKKQNPHNLKIIKKDIFEYPPLKMTNKIYKNNGDLKFSDVSSKWGFEKKDVSQGLALADLDNDGDLDLITNRLNELAGIYENTGSKPRIAVRLIGNSPNTRAIGAKIKLEGRILQDKQVIAGGNYLSGSDPLIMLAAITNKGQRLTIAWPDGKKSFIDSVRPNRIYKVWQAYSTNTADTSVQPPKPIFRDISDNLNFKHQEDSYNDFKWQPLLPFKLSQEGPGMAWIDFNNNGKIDLFQTAGKGGTLTIFENMGEERFKQRSFGKIRDKIEGDQTSIIGWKTSSGTKVLVGNSNYEQLPDKAAAAYIYTFKNGNIVKVDSIQGIPSSTGTLIAADYNGDETLDIFVGGRVIPNKYPENATSRLYKKIQGHFVLDSLNTDKLRNVGLVTSAVFTDFDLDGDQDLLISTEWGSLKLYSNEKGYFKNITKEVGLDAFRGWWKGLATGDFNNDGFPDIVATNLGTNSRYQLRSEHPLRLYYNNLDKTGPVDIVEAEFATPINAYVPMRHLYDFSSFPIMANGLKSHKEYANSSLRKIIGPIFNILPFKKINTLQSMIFLSQNGKKFTSRSLPIKAQLSMAFYAGTADYNNDGFEDLFLTQNFYGLPSEKSRLDAGRGLWLKGKGNGNFEAISGQVSGVKIYGEQRGATLGDFNNDGRVDLAVGQNANYLKLFVNQISKRGLRIQLVGPKNNISAIGSSIRLIYKDGSKGPRREIKAGSGYWSKDSSTQIMGREIDKKVKGISILWFDGKSQNVKINNSKSEYKIFYSVQK